MEFFCSDSGNSKKRRKELNIEMTKKRKESIFKEGIRSKSNLQKKLCKQLKIDEDCDQVTWQVNVMWVFQHNILTTSDIFPSVVTEWKTTEWRTRDPLISLVLVRMLRKSIEDTRELEEPEKEYNSCVKLHMEEKEDSIFFFSKIEFYNILNC